MFHKETVSSETLGVLTLLMNDTRLKEFFLVGGTALSLQIGHRISIDIDLFSLNNFDESDLFEYLEAQYQMRLDFISKNTIKGEISNVKVDLITHGYPLVQKLNETDGIRMATLPDIAAMKLNAIAGNGTRVKDFIDIAFLSSFLSLNQMLGAYQTKYNTRNSVIPFKALMYHNDINFKEPINLLNADFVWKNILARLHQIVKYPDKTFPLLL